MSDPQNPGGWPDAEEERLWWMAPVHLRVLVDRRIAAREAAARREGIEAAHNACERRLRFHLVDDYQNRDSELRAEGVRGCQGIIGDLLALSRLGGQR